MVCEKSCCHSNARNINYQRFTIRKKFTHFVVPANARSRRLQVLRVSFGELECRGASVPLRPAQDAPCGATWLKTQRIIAVYVKKLGQRTDRGLHNFRKLAIYVQVRYDIVLRKLDSKLQLQLRPLIFLPPPATPVTHVAPNFNGLNHRSSACGYVDFQRRIQRCGFE